MTLSQAITAAHAGDRNGIVQLFAHAMPTVWLTAAVLGCPNMQTAVYEVYVHAEQSLVSLHSPSDLRVWLGRSMYSGLRKTASEQGLMISGLPAETAQAYELIAALPCDQRIALLALCADGCSAAQAAELLECSDIEIKRSVRTARQYIAAEMKKLGCTANCNTSWLIACFDNMKTVLNEQTASERKHMLDCIRQNIAYEAKQNADTWQMAAEKEKNGFFSRLFRSRRFG